MSDTDINTDRSRPDTLVDKIVSAINNDDTTASKSNDQQSNISTCTKAIETNTAARPQHRRIISKMYQIIRDVCCIIVMIVSTYSLAFQNSGPKVSMPPPPRPFFSEGSLVTDWFRGELRAADLRAVQHDLSVTMYYAPWDAECQNVRQEFDITASFYYKQIHFAAVNCWQPSGECAMERSKHGGQIWPGLIAHRGNHVLVYRGPRTAPYLIRFLRNLIHPLHRVTNRSNLIELVQKYDAVIYASVKTPIEYYDVYKSALKLLEMDPTRDIAVAVSTFNLQENSSAETPALQLITSNGTVHNFNRNFTVSYLVNWTLKHLHQAMGWTTPPGFGKSKTLASVLQPYPALVLFTPRNPFLERDYAYEILRAITLQYYSCKIHPMYTQFKDAVISGLKVMRQEINNLNKICYGEYTGRKHFENHNENVSYVNSWQSHNCYVKGHVVSAFNTCLDRNQLCDEGDVNVNRHSEYQFDSDKDVKPMSDETDFNDAYFQSSVWSENNDVRSPKKLIQHHTKEACRFLSAAKILDDSNFINERISPSVYLEGLGCKSNSTLAITAIDSLRYSQLANVLGIDVLNKSDKTIAIIVDANHESHYVMHSTFTYNNLIDFIIKFSKKQLVPEMSSKINLLHQLKENQTIGRGLEQSINLLELTSKTFLPIVMEPGKAVVVLYYTPHCAFCADASRIFLTLAKVFEHLKSLQFVRIDGENHSLPWHYNMPYYPTILFFPARRKAETRAFPQGAQRTVANLVSFVLANLEPPMNLQALWLLCHKTMYAEDIRSCMNNLQRENNKLLRKTSREFWSLGNSQNRNTLYTRAILRRLKHLRILHIQLGTTIPSRYHSMAIKRMLSRLQGLWYVEKFS